MKAPAAGQRERGHVSAVATVSTTEAVDDRPLSDWPPETLGPQDRRPEVDGAVAAEVVGTARPLVEPTDPTDDGGRRRRFPFRPGTALRLAGFHAAVLVVVLGAVVAALVHQFSVSYEALAANSLADELRAYTTAMARAEPQQSLVTASVTYLQARSLPTGTVLLVVFPGSRVLSTPGSGALRNDPAVIGWMRNAPPTSVVEATRVGNRPIELLAAPIRSGHQTVGTLIAATDLSPQRAQGARVLMLSLAEATVALLAAVLSSYLLLRRLLRTVGRITTTAEEIGSGQLDRRLGDQGTDDEVGQLATAFDAMIGRMNVAMTAQRRLLSDVSHQLRTPLTVARGHLEVLERTGGLVHEESTHATVTLVVDELDHMRALVERLLLLGRAMEPDFVNVEPVDVRAFVADIYDAACVLAPRHWSLAPIPDVVVHVDSAKLRGALLNLVDNAVRATTPDDAIQFDTSVDPATGSVTFAVEDSGPGIPSAQRAAVLARFARPAARSEDGTGLGLAIVRAVAEAHHGCVEVGEARLGGARVAIVLPSSSVGMVQEV